MKIRLSAQNKMEIEQGAVQTVIQELVYDIVKKWAAEIKAELDNVEGEVEFNDITRKYLADLILQPHPGLLVPKH